MFQIKNIVVKPNSFIIVLKSFILEFTKQVEPLFDGLNY